MKRITLERVYLADRTLGSMYDDGAMIAKTLELAWRDNKTGISCIPEGIYHVSKQPPKEGRPYVYFRLPDSETKRRGILIHIANDIDDVTGCIGVASRFANVESSKPTLEDSTRKMKWLAVNLPQEFELEIKKKPV